MFKKTTLLILLSFNILFVSLVSANEKGQNERYELHINNALSGAILAITDGVTKRVNGLNKEELSRLNDFKKEINNRLQTESVFQNIYFKTADYEIHRDSVMYINNLVYSLDDFKNLKYDLSGYSDPRGNAEYNMELSLKRVKSIKALLLNLGIKKENITVNSFGEEKSRTNSNREEYFFERKVEIKISK